MSLKKLYCMLISTCLYAFATQVCAATPLEIDKVKFADIHFYHCVKRQHKKYFTQIRSLNCNHSQLKRVDELRYMSNLKDLSLQNTAISDINIHPLAKLRTIDLHDTHISHIDLSGNPNLTEFYITGDTLHGLDVTHNPKLEVIYVGFLRQAQLDLSHNPRLYYLHIAADKLTNIDLSHVPELNHLYLTSAYIHQIDVRHNPKLTYLNLNFSALSQLDLSHNQQLTELHLHHNRFRQLTLPASHKLTYLDISRNQFTDIDLSKQLQLKTLIAFNNPRLSAIKLPKTKTLSAFSYENTPLWQSHPQWHSLSVSKRFHPKFKIVSSGTMQQTDYGNKGDNAPFIHARLGLNFGITYKIELTDEDRKKENIPWMFPLKTRYTHPDLLDINSGTTGKTYDSQTMVQRTGEGTIQWLFEDPRELVAGKWKIEAFYDDQLVMQQYFYVNVPESSH